MKIFLLFITVVILPTATLANQALWVGQDSNGTPCQGREPNYGPFDYNQRSSLPGQLHMVEHAHFTPKVENLIQGQTGDMGPGGDLDYTLIAWPNHHKALVSAINFRLKIKDKITEFRMINSPECYLQRAIHFSPDDPVTYSLFGYYLRKMGKLTEAVKYFEKSLKLDPDNAKTAYSYSLLLIDLKKYEEAVKFAKIAYSNGNPPPGLRRKLENIGLWTTN